MYYSSYILSPASLDELAISQAGKSNKSISTRTVYMTRVYESIHGPAGACRIRLHHTIFFFAPVPGYSGLLLAAAIKNKKSSTRLKMREAMMGSC